MSLILVWAVDICVHSGGAEGFNSQSITSSSSVIQGHKITALRNEIMLKTPPDKQICR